MNDFFFHEPQWEVTSQYLIGFKLHEMELIPGNAQYSQEPRPDSPGT